MIEPDDFDPVENAIREDWPDDDDDLIQVHGKKFHADNEERFEKLPCKKPRPN